MSGTLTLDQQLNQLTEHLDAEDFEPRKLLLDASATLAALGSACAEIGIFETLTTGDVYCWAIEAQQAPDAVYCWRFSAPGRHELILSTGAHHLSGVINVEMTSREVLRALIERAREDIAAACELYLR